MSTLSTFYTSCHHLFSTKIIYTLNHTPMVVLSRLVACARNNLVNSTQFYLYFFHYTESRYVILRVKTLLSTQSSLHRGAEQRGRLCSGHRLLPVGADRTVACYPTGRVCRLLADAATLADCRGRLLLCSPSSV